jgi:hypothetical protein
MMKFKGYNMELASYQNSDMLGYWIPLVNVKSPDGEHKRVTLKPVHGITKTHADALAVIEAKHRINSNDL